MRTRGETFLDKNIVLELRDYNSDRTHEEIPIPLLGDDTPPSAFSVEEQTFEWGNNHCYFLRTIFRVHIA